MPEGSAKHTVVVADDVAGLRRLLRIALEESRLFEVVGEAEDGVEAIAAVKTLEPDILLLDLSMPRMDGLEALPRVKIAAPATHVIVLSGFAEERMGPRATELGADAFIEKGISPPDLVRRIHETIARPPRGPTDGGGPRISRLDSGEPGGGVPGNGHLTLQAGAPGGYRLHPGAAVLAPRLRAGRRLLPRRLYR